MRLTHIWRKPYTRPILAVILLTLASLFYRTTQADESVPTETYRAALGAIETNLTIPGQIESRNSVNLKFQTSGRLAWVGVKEGDRVKKYQTIASLDQTKLKKDLQKKLNAYLAERWDFEDLQTEYHTNSEPVQTLPLTDAEKHILEKAQFDLDSTVLTVEIADYAKRLANLATPIGGIVTRVDTPIAGINITPATAVFTVSDPNSLLFAIEIDETDLAHISEGSPVRITLDAFPNSSLAGTLTYISFHPISTGKSSIYRGEIKLDTAATLSGRLKLGLHGDAEFTTASRANSIIVPLKYITTSKGKSYVNRYQAGQTTSIQVDLGLINDTQAEIVNGLSAGDIIALPE